MADSNNFNAREYEEPLLNINTTDNGEEVNSIIDTIQGVVDYRGEKVSDYNRSKFGGWRSASLIVVGETVQAFCFFSIVSNLINYLTGPLGQSLATAAANVNVWSGVASVMPIVAALVADSYLGQFYTIVSSFIIYILGLALLTLSAVHPSLRPPDCSNNDEKYNVSCNSPSSFQVIFFFSALYLVAIGNSGYKPCACAFGADQFDERNPKECQSKSSFFNWWNFGMCFGAIMSGVILNYIQDNMGWDYGFAITCISMILTLTIFLFGTKTFRYSMGEDKENPLMRISRVFVAATINWRTSCSSSTTIEAVEVGIPNHVPILAHQFKFLDKALIDTLSNVAGSRKHGIPCTVSQVEEAKAVLHLIPLWITCLTYAVVVTQSFTFFTKQASTMDRSIGPKLQIPAASIHIVSNLSFLIFLMVYDFLLVPFARVFTGKLNGITMLQRVGCGIFVSSTSMILAALIEKKRLQTALDFGLIDMPGATVPMTVWWLLPQCVLLGLANMLTFPGLQEFFYDQIPRDLRSIGVALFYSLIGIGSFLSSFLIYVLDKLSGSGKDEYSWFSNNLNRAHLDYFYWLLTGLSVLSFFAFLLLSKSYHYKSERSLE